MLLIAVEGVRTYNVLMSQNSPISVMMLSKDVRELDTGSPFPSAALYLLFIFSYFDSSGKETHLSDVTDLSDLHLMMVLLNLEALQLDLFLHHKHCIEDGMGVFARLFVSL